MGGGDDQNQRHHKHIFVFYSKLNTYKTKKFATKSKQTFLSY